MAPEVKPFNLGGSKFNLDTFYGRWRQFLDIIDPRTLFTARAELERSIRILQQYERGNPSNVSDEELWKAQKIKQAIIHPDTQEKIAMPFRMSGMAPMSIPIVTGLLLPNQTILSTIFWQWLNQSHTAGVNYSNRNATMETSKRDFVISYFVAVTGALSISLGLNVLLRKSTQFSQAKRMLVQRFIPFPAVATASICNLLVMRNRELNRGIEVKTKNGEVVGVSKVTARKALAETAFSRVSTEFAALIIPPSVMSCLERTKWLPRFPRLYIPIQLLVCTLISVFIFPVTYATFPQTSKIKVKILEKGIQEKTKNQFVYYNKGL